MREKDMTRTNKTTPAKETRAATLGHKKRTTKITTSLSLLQERADKVAERDEDFIVEDDEGGDRSDGHVQEDEEDEEEEPYLLDVAMAEAAKFAQ